MLPQRGQCDREHTSRSWPQRHLPAEAERRTAPRTRLPAPVLPVWLLLMCSPRSSVVMSRSPSGTVEERQTLRRFAQSVAKPPERVTAEPPERTYASDQRPVRGAGPVRRDPGVLGVVGRRDDEGDHQGDDDDDGHTEPHQRLDTSPWRLRVTVGRVDRLLLLLGPVPFSRLGHSRSIPTTPCLTRSTPRPVGQRGASTRLARCRSGTVPGVRRARRESGPDSPLGSGGRPSLPTACPTRPRSHPPGCRGRRSIGEYPGWVKTRRPGRALQCT